MGRPKGSKNKKEDQPPNPIETCTAKGISDGPSSQPTLANFATFEKQAAAASQDGGKSDKTIKAYKGCIKRLTDFVKTFSESEQRQELARESFAREALDPQDEIEAGGDDVFDFPGPTNMPSDFPFALDGAPKECTPMAIAFFLYQKCFNEGCGVAVAEQIHAAVIWYYDYLDDDTYRNSWRFDAATKRYLGNPARSAKVDGMLKAIKNKNGERERHHSRAMSIEDMEQMYEYRTRRMKELEGKTDRKSREERVWLALYGAFSVLAFIIWTRNEETSQLTLGDIDFSPPPKRCSNGEEYPFFTVSLRNRKNWQRKQSKGEHQLNGHVYNIYPKPHTPAIDAYAHVLEWKAIYENEVLGGKRKLEDHELLFPTIDANLLAHTSEDIGPKAMARLINEMARAANISGAGRYTTHCFRRGGAQYRFMFAPLGQRWTLARVRWWGGWALREKGDTLIRYLLDELSTYEEDHRDALCPFDEENHIQHVGKNPETRSLSAAEGYQILSACEENKKVLQDLSKQINQLAQLPSVVNHLATTYNSPATYHTEHHPYPSPYVPPPSVCVEAGCQRPILTHSPRVSPYSAPLCHQRGPTPPMALHRLSPAPIQRVPKCHTSAFSVQPQVEFQSSAKHKPQSDSLVGYHVIPTIKTGRQATPNAWLEVVRQWEHPSPGCPIPLKDWDPSWYAETGQAMKYHLRERIATEFIDGFGRDAQAFCAAYPDYARGITPLSKAILTEHQRTGKAQVRAKRKAA